MSNPNEIELTQVEQNWLDEFTVVMNKMPKALTLRINSLGDGSVEVFSPAGKDFTPAQSRWIKRIESLLELFPKTPEFWTLSNIDGFHVGKGCPSTFSGTSYGVWGATGTYSDNYDDFYLVSFPVEFGEYSDEDREDHDCVELRSCIGDLKVWHVDEFGKKLM
ncbi:hypothetical protein LQI33_002346 [Vibrio parahaemolyticus]|uniref:hypothetical protein n=1 Tax=Vibrio parahaemolyticus TaxID=670 RepID=UPI00215B82A0|nr:hypothetical protein [Vibrio parahaemolyticus]EIO3215675.1 hypothetical protein [Vibrio parahaemolyticus]MCR9657934.1 hypothetical protein [Vibrio parahaemolyticus]